MASPKAHLIREHLMADTTVEPESLRSRPSLRAVAARVIDPVLFYSLLAVIALAAIPYGTVDPWWNALFQCLVFALAGLCIIERLFRGETNRQNHRLLLPVAALIAFALVQTIPWSSSSIDGIGSVARTLSADVFQTRLFVIQLGALVLAGWMLLLYTTSQRRLGFLVDLIIAIGLISAVFGLLRQASQRNPGFLLPYLRPGFGYAQFINSNHFAFLMEMAIGLAVGMSIFRGVTGRRLALYVTAAIPMWVALILANSRGGILSILCQVLFFGLFLGSRVGHQKQEVEDSQSWFRRASRHSVIRAVLAVGLLTAAITTVVIVGGDPLAGRVEQVQAELNSQTANSYVLRQNIWRATGALIKDHPIAGVGFGGYWMAITKYHQASGEATPQQAHSDYLELLASGGLIGFSIGIWFTVAFVKAARRKLRAADPYQRAVTLGALAGILAVAVHSLVDFGLHITINALIFTVLVSLVAINIGDREWTDR